MPVKFRIRTVPHYYPNQGVMFRRITTLLNGSVDLRATVGEQVRGYQGEKNDKIASDRIARLDRWRTTGLCAGKVFALGEFREGSFDVPAKT